MITPRVTLPRLGTKPGHSPCAWPFHIILNVPANVMRLGKVIIGQWLKRRNKIIFTCRRHNSVPEKSQRINDKLSQ